MWDPWVGGCIYSHGSVSASIYSGSQSLGQDNSESITLLDLTLLRRWSEARD